jgi:acetyl-CoA carboxylase biotin carboxyl carrier protein
VADVEAHITGTVWKVEVAVGDTVVPGDAIIIIESMKMEMPVETEVGGTLVELLCVEGDAIAEGDVIARIQ